MESKRQTCADTWAPLASDGLETKKWRGSQSVKKTGLHVMKAMEDPKDHCAGQVCGQQCGNRHISRFQGVSVSSYFFFSAPFFSSFLF